MTKSKAKKGGGGWLGCFSLCAKPEPEEDTVELDFAHCSLNDVPNDIFAHERTLERLYLTSNSLSNLPRELFHCHQLKILDVSDNEMKTLPDALASLGQLNELILNKNFIDHVPDSIKQLKQLTVLNLSANPLTKIPEGCTQLVSISELYLNDIGLEFLPANFGRLVKLRILELRENAITALPKSLARLTSLQRLDLGANYISEVPEVIGSLVNLRELWLGENRITEMPAQVLENLTNLIHLDLSVNFLQHLPDQISQCRQLEHLDLSANYLVALPPGLGGLEKLVALNAEENRIGVVPESIGYLQSLEELMLSDNKINSLPTSIGLCRKLHTLNVDHNRLDVLPKEIGSCTSLRILSACNNNLTSLPAELDHISGLAVISVASNRIQHLPVSFMKLKHVSALWLSRNQTKPLIQLNQDTDPETGQRVLTNYLLPQPEADESEDNVSESGSFHASVWEEEHERKSQVRWAENGRRQAAEDELRQGHDPGGQGQGLRREPTPFPKEMREMARRMENLRKDPATRKRSRDDPPPDLDLGHIQIKEAIVSRPQVSPQHDVLPVFDPDPLAKEQLELEQFEELEKSLNVPVPSQDPRVANVLASPDKTSRDSGVITPSDEAMTTTSTSQPPPYHIAAAFSKHARDFSEAPGSTSTSEDRRGSLSEQSEASTTPSSLQTIVRSPAFAKAKATSAEARSSGIAISQSRIASLKKTPRPDMQSEETHAMQLRKVSEQLLANPRTRQSLTGIPVLNSRPGSFASPKGTTLASPRPSSQMSLVDNSSNGLLSTIEQAVHSDDEAQPNYENVSTPNKTNLTDNNNSSFLSQNGSDVAKISRLPTRASMERVSTAQYVSSRKSSLTNNSSSFQPSKIPSRVPTPNMELTTQSKLPKPVLSPRTSTNGPT